MHFLKILCIYNSTVPSMTIYSSNGLEQNILKDINKDIKTLNMSDRLKGKE